MGKIVLHTCCAPCSGAIIEYMVNNGMRPLVFFSNSNITPGAEYEKRRAEVLRYAESFGLEVVDDDYSHKDWQCAVKGLENEPERGARCFECFRFRLLRAARYAAGHGYDTLTTSLASSRWKDLDQVNRAGEEACAQVLEETGIKVGWWGMNWRKGGFQPRRSEIIREQKFYNQEYCGCEFSVRKQHNMEIERKFLVKGPFSEWIIRSEQIVQGYVCSHTGRTVRVRMYGDKAFLTIKGPSADGGLSRFEWEKEISAGDAKELFTVCEPGIIDKVRNLVEGPDGHIWEVDEFHGENEGLVMAELELKTENEEFERPSWLGEEVTGDRRYYNSSLKENPYKNWGK